MRRSPLTAPTAALLALLTAGVATPASAAQTQAPPDEASAPDDASDDAGDDASADERASDEAGSEDTPGAYSGPDAVTAETPAEQEQRAIALYFAGEEAYNLGDFSVAIEKFEQAYALSNKPDLLYNVALAYYRRYQTSRDVGDIQRARAVLVNFEIALKRDPSIGDPQQVQELMRQIDAELDLAERAADVNDAAASVTDASLEGPEPGACPDIPLGDDPGKKSRVAGAATLGVGGLLLAGGAASIAAFTLKGQEFENTLTSLQAEQEAAGCTETSTSQRCQVLQESVDTTVANGRQANILAATLGTSLTVFGVAGVVTGAVLFVQGSQRSRAWERRREISVAPTLGGLVLRGRF